MGKIFVRERLKIGPGAQKPRFAVVATADLDLQIFVPNLRRSELEELATSTGAELVYLPRGEYAEDTSADKGKGRQHKGKKDKA